MASLSSPAQLNYPDTFLREVAPQVKSAELIAEDNARQNCVANISTCFQQACRDNIDPSDPDGSDASAQRELVGSKQLNQWNYKETITATFEWDTLICHKCTRSTLCEKTATPFFGGLFCKKWGETTEVCQDIEF